MKNFIFILMAIFTIGAFGSFTIPDDVGDPVVMVDQCDQSSVVSVDVLNIDVVDVDHPDTGMSQQIHGINHKIEWGTIQVENNFGDVGWKDAPVISSTQPPSQSTSGSAGGNPGWC